MVSSETGVTKMENEKSESVSGASSAPHTDHHQKRTWTEEIEVAGSELVSCVKRLAAEGRVSRIRLVEPDGDIVLETPLTIGAIAGGAVVLAAPLLAVIGAIAAFVTKVKLEIVRTGDRPDDKPKTQ
jgi:Domain of unknown function (DUF4342)